MLSNGQLVERVAAHEAAAEKRDARIAALEAANNRTSLCAVRDLGLIPNNPEVDNAAILTAAIRDNRVNDTVHFPGGAYYAKTEVNDQHKSGLNFEGQGIATWDAYPNNYIHPDTGKPHRLGDASVRWIYTGNGAAWRISGDGTELKGINLWHGWQSNRETIRGGWGTSIGVLCDYANAQNGQWSFDRMAVCGFSEGFAITGRSQCDLTEFGQIWLESNRTHFYFDNGQTTGLLFRHLVSAGEGEVFFDIANAGNFHIVSLYLNDPRLVFRFQNTGSNTCTYTVDSFKADNNSAGWRLAQMERPGPLNLSVTGHVSNKATPGEHPVVLRTRDPEKYGPNYTRARLDIWGTELPAEVVK